MSNLLMFPASGAREIVGELQACDDGDAGEIDELHRQYTLLLLRRYFRNSIDMGRLPSMLGRKESFFRAKVSSYKLHTFEDAVIFVHDMERSLEKLDEMSRKLIAAIVFMEYSRTEVADALGIYRTTVSAKYEQALDLLARILLESKLINPAEVRRAAARRRRVDNAAKLRDFPRKKPCSTECFQGATLPSDAATGGAESK